MKDIALSIGNQFNIIPPANVPSGNLFDTGQNAIAGMVGMVFVIAIFVAFGSLILAGIRWIMSEGKKENIESIKTQIIFTIVGLVVIFVSFIIVKIIGFSIGIPLLSGG